MSGAAVASLEERHDAGKNLAQDFFGQRVDFATASGVQIKNAQLIASNHSRRANPGDRHGKADSASDFATAGDGQDNRQTSRLIKLGGRDHEDGTTASLLVSRGGIERDEVNIAALHSNSPPTAGASSHACSSVDRGPV